MTKESKVYYLLSGTLIVINLYFVLTLGTGAWWNVLTVGFVVGMAASKAIQDLANR